MPELLFKQESYILVGICMDIHRTLGHGFKEIVYKDALEYELQKKGLLFEREKEFSISYKEIILKHRYYADFVVNERIILEIKTASAIIDSFVLQTVNYLKASNLKLGLVVNFDTSSLEFQRVVF
ncbi:GxxExxY protein [Solitalea longa]|uniref:GxxExxY protein n=1 Tax=Solitalea longa TaxID=2079460 RepID=A0A2S4ZY15_9SPHI|nr:GxxExxY protein [Solitalea longa]POY34783.1 GxxExxY protein [Solitalea longa]